MRKGGLHIISPAGSQMLARRPLRAINNCPAMSTVLPCHSDQRNTDFRGSSCQIFKLPAYKMDRFRINDYVSNLIMKNKNPFAFLFKKNYLIFSIIIT